MEILDDAEQDNLPLGRVFSSSSARILDFLLLNHDLKYTEAEISELSGIPQRTLQRTLKGLIDEKIIKRTRESKSFVYQANLSSKRTEFLMKYIQTTIDDNLNNPELLKQPTDV